VWNLADPALTESIEAASAGNLKRTWAPTLDITKAEGKAFLEQATETKTVWIPYGA
jgi:aldehyde dehydrogenase (NAD+)